MKVLIGEFVMSPYGGIAAYVTEIIKGFKSLGCDVDLFRLSPSKITQKAYDAKCAELKSGDYKYKSSSGFEYDANVGYWCNSIEGYMLPPSNRIPVYEEGALEQWHKLADTADIVLWNFLPTHNRAWEGKNGQPFDYWYKFFDLPSSVSQVYIVHDISPDKRNTYLSVLKDKILFLAVAHLVGYKCCENIGIPRSLLLNPRFLDEKKSPATPMKSREVDFFAGHIFKPVKHLEEYIRAIPYINAKKQHTCWLAGAGIEQNYMTAPVKIKPRYICSKTYDPDLDPALEGKVTIWNRALECGMEYFGLLSVSQVSDVLDNAKFAIDPQYSPYGSLHGRTHINGFIIEALVHGTYPVIRDYRGITPESLTVEDPIFDVMEKIAIPWDATPKQFAQMLKGALRMDPEKYLADTDHNYKVALELFNARANAEEIIRICKGGKKYVNKHLECGEDSPEVQKSTNKMMEEFFHIPLPLKWENK